MRTSHLVSVFCCVLSLPMGCSKNAAGWDGKASSAYEAACNAGNKEPAAYATFDCACEVAKWKAGTVTYREWVADTPKAAEMGVIYSGNCAAAAGERAWTSEKRSDFLTRCGRTDFGAAACQCLVERMVARNLSEERMYTLSEAKDQEIYNCLSKNKPGNPQVKAEFQLPQGTFPVATAEWQKARDGALAWCGSNAGKCTGDAAELLKKPADGVLTVGASGDATLTTCSPGNCPAVTLVEFKRAGSTWSITKVEWSAMGD